MLSTHTTKMSQKPEPHNKGIFNRYCFPSKRLKSQRFSSKTSQDNIHVAKSKENNILLSNSDKKEKNVRTYHSQGMNTEPFTNNNDNDNNNYNNNNGISHKIMDLSTKCSNRVRQVIQLLQSDGISKDDLLKSLGYAVELMDAIANEEQINAVEEDDINVTPDAVPLEVRDWIASTFSTTVNRTSRSEKPRFRAVANAIRAGIMVEKGNHSYKINLRVSMKIFKKSNEVAAMKIPNDISRLLKTDVNEWSFDIFKLDDMSGGHSLRFIALDLFLRYNFFHKYKINVQNFENLCQRIEEGYSKYRNPYHNLVHGADVAQTCHYVVYTYQLGNWLKDIEIFALLFAALIHDFEHTGTTNNFHININSDLSLLYNDRGVLENHHVSAIFRIMQDPNFNIIKHLDKEDYRVFRNLVIEVVLNTDMSTHFKQMKNMKSHLALGENLDKGMALSMILHCADISHPSKDWNIHERWTLQLLDEFFIQGDKEAELKLPFSPLCDRKTILIPDSQIGFSNFIVEPSFNILGNMLQFIIEKMRHDNRRTSRISKTSKEINETSRQSIRSVAQTNSPKSSIQHAWEAKILINRSIWQKKLEQDKAKKTDNAVQEADNNKK